MPTIPAEAGPHAAWWRRARLRLSRPSLRQGVMALSNQGICSANNFLTSILVARACPAEQFAMYMLGQTVVNFFKTTQNSLIATPYTFHSQKLNGAALKRYSGSTLAHQAALSGVAFVGSLLGAAGARVWYSVDFAWVFVALAFALAFILMRELIRRICFATFRINDASWFDAVVTVLQVGLMAGLAWAGRLSAAWAYLAATAACGVVNAWWLRQNRLLFHFETARWLDDWKKNWALGKWIYASLIITLLAGAAYPWLLLIFHGPRATGIWAACFGIVNLGNPFQLGIQNYLAPKIAHASARRTGRRFHLYLLKITAVYVGMMLPYSLLFLALGDPLVSLMYGNLYAGQGAVIAPLALNILFASTSYTFSTGLIAIGRADLNFYSNICSLIFLFTAGIGLAYQFGPVGAAYGFLGGNVLITVMRYAVFWSHVERGEAPAGGRAGA
ncbi:MAG: lipopolysaccharide biosynthesis protein [bacterium]